MKFRKLKANEIDARVSTVSEKGCSLLLYKDARVDQNILDETVGAENWQRSHQIIGTNLYCTVSIWDQDKAIWVSKQDVGTESYTEKEKGQASDSFKRACFNWGIGRELYTAPFIWIKAGDVKLEDKGGGKKTTYDTFSVKDIGYDDDGNINKLKIYNNKQKKVVYTLGKTDNTPVTEEEQFDSETDPYPTRAEMLAFVKTKYPEGSKNLAALLAAFNVDSLDKASDAQIQTAYNKVHK
jgi:hypothetical protein